VASGVATNAIYAYDPCSPGMVLRVLQPFQTRAGGAAAAVYGDHYRHGLVDWWAAVDFVNVFGVPRFTAGGNGWVALPDMLEKRAPHERRCLERKFLCHRWVSALNLIFLIGTTSNQKLTCRFGPTPNLPLLLPTPSCYFLPSDGFHQQHHSNTYCYAKSNTEGPRPTPQPRPTPPH